MKDGRAAPRPTTLGRGAATRCSVLPSVIAIGTPIDGIAEYHYLQFGGQRWGLYGPEPDANPYRAIRLHQVLNKLGVALSYYRHVKVLSNNGVRPYMDKDDYP